MRNEKGSTQTPSWKSPSLIIVFNLCGTMFAEVLVYHTELSFKPQKRENECGKL